MRPSTRLVAHLVTCLAVIAGLSDAFWRLPCRGKAGVARLDPIVNPGTLSYHAHSVQGSGNFAMSVTQDSLRQSNCTSCAVKQDKSSYWAPALYFIHANGSAELVQQAGGMLVYYLLYGENVKAFPDNFRMLAGDTFQRNFSWPIPDPPTSDWTADQLTQTALRQKAIGFNCLNYHAVAEPSLYRHFLPSKAFLDAHCKDGLRFELMFPSCWNGKDVDTPDHKSHMAYPNLVMAGQCPSGFETRLVSLFYETIWDTPAFKDKEGSFVIANGDPTGFGYHGDFIQGWDPDFLQNAIHTCTSASGEISDCPLFDLQSEAEQAQCKFQVPEQLQSENVNLHPTGLPGKIAIQSGPAYASPLVFVTTSSSSTGSFSSSTSRTTSSAVSTTSLETSTTSPESSTTFSAASRPSLDANTRSHEATSSSLLETTATSPKPSTTSTTRPMPSYVQSAVTEDIVYVEQEMVITVDVEDNPIGTATGGIKTLATSPTVVNEVVFTVEPKSTLQAVKRDHNPHHMHQRNSHGHHRHGHFHRPEF